MTLIHRIVQEAEGAPRLLWVHGYTLDGTIWGTLWRLMPEFAHIALDLPGHGRSRPLAEDETLASMAEDLLAVADAERATDLVGMSFGGMCALEAAIRAPGRFRSVILASPGLAGGPLDEEAATCNQELMALARERGIGPWLAARWMSVPPRIFAGVPRGSALFRELEAVVLRHAWWGLLTPAYAGFQQTPQSPLRIARIGSPVTLLLGEEDMPAFLRAGELIRRSAPQAVRRMVPGACHLCLLERPETCAGLIRAAVAATRAESPREVQA